MGASTAADSDAYDKPLNCSVSEKVATPLGCAYASTTAATAAGPEGSGVWLRVAVASGVCEGLGRTPRDSVAAPVALAYTLGVDDGVAPREILAVLGAEVLGEALAGTGEAVTVPDADKPGAMLEEMAAADSDAATEPLVVAAADVDALTPLETDRVTVVVTDAAPEPLTVTAAVPDGDTPGVRLLVGVSEDVAAADTVTVAVPDAVLATLDAAAATLGVIVMASLAEAEMPRVLDAVAGGEVEIVVAALDDAVATGEPEIVAAALDDAEAAGDDETAVALVDMVATALDDAEAARETDAVDAALDVGVEATDDETVGGLEVAAALDDGVGAAGDVVGVGSTHAVSLTLPAAPLVVLPPT